MGGCQMAICRPPITDPPTPHPEAFSSMKQHSPYHQPESNAHWQKGCTPRGSLQGPRPVCGWVEGAGPCSQSKSPRASITGTRDAFTVASLKGGHPVQPQCPLSQGTPHTRPLAIIKKGESHGQPQGPKGMCRCSCNPPGPVSRQKWPAQAAPHQGAGATPGQPQGRQGAAPRARPQAHNVQHP